MEPGPHDAYVVAGLVVHEEILAGGGVQVRVGDDGLEAGGGLAGDPEGLGAGGHHLGVDGAVVSQFSGLLDDGSARRLALGGHQQRVRILTEQLGQLAAEVDHIGRVVLRRGHGASELLELRYRRAADPLRVVRRLGDGRHLSRAVRPNRVAHVRPHLQGVYRRAEDVVSGEGDVRARRRRREEDDALLFRQRRDAQGCTAARSPQDDLDAVHVGQLVVGANGVLRRALGVLHDEFQHPAVDAARGVDLLRRQQLRLGQGNSVGLADAGQRSQHANDERLPGTVGRRRIGSRPAGKNRSRGQPDQ